jgi:hypothetical protein
MFAALIATCSDWLGLTDQASEHDARAVDAEAGGR